MVVSNEVLIEVAEVAAGQLALGRTDTETMLPGYSVKLLLGFA
jgi:hypothetical protein